MSQYKMIFTNVGLIKKQNAELNADYINIVKFAVGDGIISSLEPTMNGLLSEKYRAAVGNADTKNGTTVFDLIIPSTVGGFFIREVALFDADGDCIMIGIVPVTYKVDQAEGSSKSVHLRVSSTSQNTENIHFTTDDSLVYATVSFVNSHINDKDDPHETMAKVNIELAKKSDKTHNHNTLYLGINANAASATKLKTPRTIGGVSFDGSANINLAGVNISGNQNTSGNAASATKLKISRRLGGIWFNGSADISLPGVNISGNQDTSGTASNAIKLDSKTLNQLKVVFFPPGIITMWSGSVSSIPSGWFLCNGSNNTPDLRNKFIYGASSNLEVETTGGSADSVVVAHNHSASTNTTGNHNHTLVQTRQHSGDGDPSQFYNRPADAQGTYTYTSNAINSAGNHSHSVTVNSSGESGTNKNLPPYMKLAYIMKG